MVALIMVQGPMTESAANKGREAEIVKLSDYRAVTMRGMAQIQTQEIRRRAREGEDRRASGPRAGREKTRANSLERDLFGECPE